MQEAAPGNCKISLLCSKIAGAVSRGEADRGILICSTGIGMSILANRFKGSGRHYKHDTYMAKMTRAHNDSNVLCLGGKVIGELEALDILDAWLDTEYEAGRHSISLELIGEAEEHLSQPITPQQEELFHDFNR
ncbi:MAG: RpiB/LacA/LacB family sugar-phosphate isomerase [Enterocloster bolteae]